MKYLLLVTSLFLIRSVQAQDKGTNTIIIKMDTTGAFKRLTNLLYDNGYSVELSDPANGALFSTEKTVNSLNVKIRIRLKDSAVYITGLMALANEMSFMGTTLPKTFHPILCTGMKGSLNRQAWNELNSFATSFSMAVSDKIEYVKN